MKAQADERSHAFITGADSVSVARLLSAFARRGSGCSHFLFIREQDARETRTTRNRSRVQPICSPGDLGEPSECKLSPKKAIEALGTVDSL